MNNFSVKKEPRPMNQLFMKDLAVTVSRASEPTMRIG